MCLKKCLMLAKKTVQKPTCNSLQQYFFQIYYFHIEFSVTAMWYLTPTNDLVEIFRVAKNGDLIFFGHF